MHNSSPPAAVGSVYAPGDMEGAHERASRGDASLHPPAARSERSAGSEAGLLASAGRAAKPLPRASSRFSRIADRLGFDPHMFAQTATDSPPRKLDRTFTGISSSSSGSPGRAAGMPGQASAPVDARRRRFDSADTAFSGAEPFASDVLSHISTGQLSSR